MTDLVAKLEKKRFGAGGRKAAAEAANGDRPKKSRYIPKAIRREVYERDGGCCTYVDGSGRRCRERSGLELDHICSHAMGAELAVDNLRLRCGPHNRLHAEQCFGPLFVAHRAARPSPRGARAEAKRPT